MTSFVLVQFTFPHDDMEYKVSTTFLLRPGMKLHISIEKARERERAELAKRLFISEKALATSEVSHLQVEENECAPEPDPVLQSVVLITELTKQAVLLNTQLNAMPAGHKSAAIMSARDAVLETIQKIADATEPPVTLR